MSEFFLFTVCCIFKDFVQRIDFDRLEDARDYYDRHISDRYMVRIELIGFSSLVGVITILESPRLDKPRK
jgi:hypothetical protein